MEQMESTELVADFVTTAGAMGTDDVYVFRYKCAFGAHYLALSCSISLYLAKRKICAVSLQQKQGLDK